MSVDSARVRDYYDRYWSPQGFEPLGRMTIPLRRLLEEHTSSVSVCLDVGCGDGGTTGLWLNARAGSYVGVDVSERAVAAAVAKGLNAQVVEDASKLPFPDNTFTVVVCIEVLEHLFDPQLAAAEISRVLRPGGVLIATVPNVAYWRRRVDLALIGRWNPLGDDLSVQQPWRDPHIRFFTAAALSRMLSGAGFERIVIGGHGGTILGDIPHLRKLCRRSGGWTTPEWRSNIFYSWFERITPALFGYRLHAVARTPASNDS
jgi:methionine biosynthesis protein MetW